MRRKRIYHDAFAKSHVDTRSPIAYLLKTKTERAGKEQLKPKHSRKKEKPSIIQKSPKKQR
jgi:hypothetical protein